jgi:hypothetical protein
MRRFSFVVLLLTAFSACAPAPMDPERAAILCEDRARSSGGPSGSVTMSINSQSGPSIDGEIMVTGDYVRGLDPIQVYEMCVFQRTGQPPIRTPVFR